MLKNNIILICLTTASMLFNINLNVPQTYQNPELPNGCEVTSLTMAVDYKGYNFDKITLANTLPHSSNPNLGFIGSPFSRSGFYCFNKPICAVCDTNGINYEDITGCDVNRLNLELIKGNPVVVWGTLRWTQPTYCRNGLYSNLHCVCLKGYNGDCYIIADPLYGERYIPKSQFVNIWTIMGKRAVVIK